MLRVSRGIVCATGRGQSVSPSSPRLLVVTGQGLSQVPMSYKSVKFTKTLAFTNLNYVASTKLYPTASPDIGLVYSHTKADGSYNNQDLPLHPLILDLCAISCLQTCSIKAEVERLSPKSFCVFQSYNLHGGQRPNLHDKPWPRLQAWSAGKPQFHSLPWSDSTQSHNPVHKHCIQRVKETRIDRQATCKLILYAT